MLFLSFVVTSAVDKKIKNDIMNRCWYYSIFVIGNDGKMEKYDKNKKKENRKIFYGLTLVTQIGISMMVPIFICVAIAGIVQDRTQSDIAVPIGILIGIMAAFRNVYILTKKFYTKDMERENRELKYFEDMKKEREQRLDK